MPKYVDFKGEGLVEFPDDMSDEDIIANLTKDEQAIQAQLIESKKREFESETLDDPQNQPTAFERVAAGAGSLTRGAGENYARSLRGVQSLVEGAGDALPTTLREWITPATWRTSMSPKEGAGELDEALPTVDPTTQTGIQGSLVNPVMSGLGQVAGTAPLGVIPAVTLSTFSEIDDAYTREIQRQKDDGETENKAKAAGKAALYGALSGYIENKLGIGRLIRKYGKAGEEAGKKLGRKTAGDILAGYSEEAFQKLGQDFIVDGKPDWSSINQEGIIGGLVQGIAGVPANVGNRRIGGRKPAEDTQKAHTEAPPDETSPPGAEPPPVEPPPPGPETEVPPGSSPPPGTRPPPTQSEANQILTILNPPEGDENAVPKPPATEGLLRKTGSEVGLPRVEPAQGSEEGATGTETEEGAAVVRPKVGDPADEFGAIYGPLITKDEVSTFRNRSGEEYALEMEPGTSAVVKVKPSALWVEVRRKNPRSAVEDIGIAYLKIGPDGQTILNSANHGRPIDELARNKLLEVLGSGNIGKKTEVEGLPPEVADKRYQLLRQEGVTHDNAIGLINGSKKLMDVVAEQFDEFSNPRDPNATHAHEEAMFQAVGEAWNRIGGILDPSSTRKTRVVKPRDDLRVTVQQPLVEGMQATVQISDPNDTENDGAVTLPEGGLDFTKLPQGKYTYGEAVKKLEEMGITRAPINPDEIAKEFGMVFNGAGPDGLNFTSKGRTFSVPVDASKADVESALKRLDEKFAGPTVTPEQAIAQAEAADAALKAEKATTAIREMLAKHEDTGEIGTVRDLADQLSDLENLPPDVQSAIDDYRAAFDEDMNEFGGRGDPDQYEGEFLAAVRKALTPKTPKAPKPPKAKKEPKAPKAPKVPKQPKARKAGRPRGTTRPPDVLDDVQDLLGTKGRLNREQALQIDPYFRDRPKWFKMLFRNKGTELGKMGSQIGDSGGNAQFANDHEALYWALLNVRGQRAADRAGLKREENHIKRMIRLVSGQRKPGEPKAEKHQRHPEDFAIGTTFKIAGQPVRVHARDTENGIVELRGEGDIGQTFLSETDRIYVDEGSYQDPDIQESTEDPETPFDQRPNQKRPFSRPLWEMTDDELDDIFRNPPRGRRGQDVAAKTYTFASYDEFKQWMDERYKALDLEGMRLGYASADAAFKKRYFVENKADGHKRSWIAHVSTGYPIDQNPAPVPATSRPDPASMGTGGRGRPPSRPSEPPPPPRDPTDLAPFNLEALVQLLRTYGNYPRINTLLRKAYGQFRTKTEGVELKERLLWDPVLARRVLSHEIGHFIDLAISLPGKGKQFAERWQPLKDFKDKIAQAKDLRDAARSLSRAWRGPFVNGDSYRDSAAELFADVMSAILTKPELVNQQWPLLHDTFKGLVDGKPAFKAAYDDLTGFLKADTIGDLGTEQRREGYKASHKQVAGKEEVSRIGLWKGLRRALVSRWDHLRTILPGERSLGSRTIDQVEDNDLMSVRNGALFASRFQRTVQPEIEKIDGGGEDGRLTLAEYMEAGRVVGERTASGQWIEQNFDEALDLLNEILEAVPDLGSKYRAKLENAQTGQDLYDIAAEMFREAHDIGPSALKTIESVVNDFDDELNGAAMLQAFNVRGKLLNPSGMTVEAAQKLQAKIMARQTPEGRQAIKKAENAFFEITSEVMTQAHDMGLIKDSTWKNLIQPNLRNYIPFSVLDYWDGKVGAGVRHQVGTAKNIADPILAMQLKMGSMFNWMQKQLTTQMLMDAYGRAGYAIPVGKRLRGPGALRAEQEKHPHDDVSRLQLWVNGQPHLIELPDDPGKSFQTATDKPSFLQDLSLWTNSYAGRLSRGALSLYTTLSPSFLFWRNTMRDFQTAANRVGYRSALKVTAKNTKEAWKLSRNYARAAFGEPMLPEVERLVASGALPPPQLSRAFYHDPELLAQMIANGGLTAMQLHGARPPSDTVPAGPIRKRAREAMLFGERVASALEALPKIQTEAAARESGLTPAQATAMARRAGIPNPAIGGRWSGFIEAFMPWTRVHIQGMRSTVDMLKDPKFNKRFLGRVMAIEMAPRLARYAIASSIIASTADDDDENRGWLASLGEFFRRASPYKIAMDNLIPIGWRDNRTGEWMPLTKTFGKTASEIPDHWEAISFRIPSSEEGKMWGSLLWGLLSGMDKDVSRAGKGVLENAGDWAINSALPGVNPTFETARQQYSLWLQGKNPLDSFRGTPAANQEMFDAGGGARAQANVGALFNQLGDAGKVAAFVATGLGMNPNATDWSHRGREKPDILTKIPVTASMFAFDNYARFRTEQNAELEEKKYGARARMLMPEDVRSLYDYYTKNVGRQKHLDDVEKQKFQVAKNWHSSIWGTRSQSTRQYSRALAAVMPTGSKEAQATVKRDLSDISKAYVDLFDSLK